MAKTREAPTANGRIAWIDTLRGIAMLLVVLGHCQGKSSTAGIIIYSFHMPLFFMISGLLFRVSKYDSPLACIKNKAVSLLVPYACFFVLNIGLQILVKRLLGNPVNTKPAEYLIGFLTAGKSGVTSCNALWFLPCLFFVSILYWLLYRLHDHGRLHIGISLALLLEIGLVLDYYNLKAPLWTDCVPMCTVFYGIGHHFMLHHQAIIERLGWRDHRVRYFATAFVLFVIGVAAALANGRITVSGNGYHFFAFSAAHIACLSLATTMLAIAMPPERLLSFVGTNSLAYLGLHRHFLLFLERYPITGRYALKLPLVTTVAVLIALVPLVLFINRYLPFMVGKRMRRSVKD